MVRGEDGIIGEGETEAVSTYKEGRKAQKPEVRNSLLALFITYYELYQSVVSAVQ